jgi:hypothetical protein
MFVLGTAFGIAFSLLCIELEKKYGNIKIVKKDKEDRHE